MAAAVVPRVAATAAVMGVVQTGAAPAVLWGPAGAVVGVPAWALVRAPCLGLAWEWEWEWE